MMVNASTIASTIDGVVLSHAQEPLDMQLPLANKEGFNNMAMGQLCKTPFDLPFLLLIRTRSELKPFQM